MQSLKVIVVILSVLNVLCEDETAGELEVECGQRTAGVGRIFGGNDTVRNEWPWLVSLVLVRSNTFFCAGSIISSDRVLTAAHCIQRKGKINRLIPEDFLVYLGKHNLSNPDEFGSEFFHPTMVIIHPDWDIASNRFEADLALLVAETPIRYTAVISPICLWIDPNESSATVGTVVGWGKSERTNGHEEVPFQVDVQRLRDVWCITSFPTFASIFSKIERAFCAKGLISGTGPCSGDSGGGFFVQHFNVWHLQGIVSVGGRTSTGSCDVGQPTIFTKVSSFRDWITQKFETATVVLECEANITTQNFIFHKKSIQSRIPVDQQCFAINLVVKQLFTDLTLEGSSTENANIERLVILDQNINALPNKIGKILPNLKELVIENSRLEFLSRGKFTDMHNLQKLAIREKIEFLPVDTFSDLTSLQELSLDNFYVQRLHMDVFVYNENLVKVEIQSSNLALIDEGTFRNNRNLLHLEFRRTNLKAINRKFFEDLRNLQNLTVTDAVYAVDEAFTEETFYELLLVERINIKNNHLKDLHESSFVKNLNLLELDVSSNKIEVIHKGLFRNNQKLTRIDFSNNLIKDVKADFSVFRDLEYISLSRNVCVSRIYSQQSNTILEAKTIAMLMDEIRNKCQASD